MRAMRPPSERLELSRKRATARGAAGAGEQRQHERGSKPGRTRSASPCRGTACRRSSDPTAEADPPCRGGATVRMTIFRRRASVVEPVLHFGFSDWTWKHSRVGRKSIAPSPSLSTPSSHANALVCSESSEDRATAIRPERRFGPSPCCDTENLRRHRAWLSESSLGSAQRIRQGSRRAVAVVVRPSSRSVSALVGRAARAADRREVGERVAVVVGPSSQASAGDFSVVVPSRQPGSAGKSAVRRRRRRRRSLRSLSLASTSEDSAGSAGSRRACRRRCQRRRRRRATRTSRVVAPLRRIGGSVTPVAVASTRNSARSSRWRRRSACATGIRG